MKPNNFWEADQLRKLVTVAQVDAEIARHSALRPPHSAQVRRRLGFLARLKEHRATDGLNPADLRWNLLTTKHTNHTKGKSA